MFDSILKKSIQRWEYEGGRVVEIHNGNGAETMGRNELFRPWMETNRVKMEKEFRSEKHPVKQS